MNAFWHDNGRSICATNGHVLPSFKELANFAVIPPSFLKIQLKIRLLGVSLETQAKYGQANGRVWMHARDDDS